MTSAPDHTRARAVWNRTPVGSQRSTATPGDPRYFADLRQYRYGYETPFIPEFFEFATLRGKSVLEIGVGNGIDACEMIANGAHYTGIDVTERHLELTKANVRQQHGFEPRLLAGDLLASDPGQRFDAVYSFGVLHHVPSEQAYLDKCRDLLAPSGRLMIGLYSKWSAFNAYLLATWLLKDQRRHELDDWRSHVTELTDLGAPVPIRIRTRREVQRLLEGAGFRVRRYAKRGFVQRYVPVVGRYLAPAGPVLTTLGATAGWYHLFICEPSDAREGRSAV